MGSHCFCLGCGYSLAGLQQRVCPECGRPFDPNDPKTFAASARVPSRTSWILVALALIGALSIYPCIELGLAAGYGYRAFGVWQPPNSAVFHSSMSALALSILAVSALFCIVVLARGPKGPRIAATLPLILDLIWVGLAVYSSVA
jgi:hypothetical protein